MSRATLKAIQAAAGNAGGGPVYVDDVFSTYLYTGTGGNRDIENGIDLAGEGGLVWIKDRTYNIAHYLTDTERGATKVIYSNSSSAEETKSESLMSFNSNGFSLGTNTSVNGSLNEVASWTFRKAPGFFDVVTYTGDGTNGRQIPHNLGSVPGMIIIKRTSLSSSWYCWHRNYTGAGLYLNSTSVYTGDTPAFNTSQSSTTFNLSTTSNNINASGYTYVAYLFAHDAQDFGTDEDESIIKCGSYTGNGSTDGPEIDLGWEPQWILIKGASSTATYDWKLYDTMRGLPTGQGDNILQPNKYDAEETNQNNVDVTATGFKLTNGSLATNKSGETYIYMAIRRPMKTPESGTEVFNDTFQYGEDGKTAGYLGSPADLDIRIDRTGGGSLVRDRLRGDLYLRTQATDAEAGSQSATWDNMTGYFYYSPGTSANTNIIHYAFKRATGFFDVVAYTGTGSTAAYQSNLGVPVEFVIVKRRDSAGDWYCWHTSFGQSLVPNIKLNSNAAKSSATLAVWLANPNLANYFWVTGVGNTSGADYISYHFATLDGVSKVGSYTGTGSNVNVDCGFSAGVRFILIKRTDSTGDWYVWDSVRGIVAGNDPYLLLNSTAAEVTSTDYIDPLSSGFTVTSSAPAALNASGGTYIFYAIA